MMIVPMFMILLLAHLQPSRQSDNNSSWLPCYDEADRTPLQFKLQKRLSEASGLTVSEEGKLFTHDEESRVWSIRLTTPPARL